MTRTIKRSSTSWDQVQLCSLVTFQIPLIEKESRAIPRDEKKVKSPHIHLLPPNFLCFPFHIRLLVDTPSPWGVSLWKWVLLNLDATTRERLPRQKMFGIHISTRKHPHSLPPKRFWSFTQCHGTKRFVSVLIRKKSLSQNVIQGFFKKEAS